MLNGRLFKVIWNLITTLRSLRLVNSIRALWFDAVFINQANVYERNSQVSQTNLIYQNATRVPIWLGKESNTSAFVFDSFKNSRLWPKLKETLMLGALSFPFVLMDYCACCEKPRERPENMLDDIPPYVASAVKLTPTEALIKLLQRPLWKRVWVLQESFMAKEVVFLCGSRAME